MILPDLVLPSRAHQHWQYCGMDSLEQCLDKRHFVNYPHSIEYTYNSRGFRDREWPDSLDELRGAVWCIGDSFTVGLGQPYGHIWPQVLSTTTGRRCINVSMDGASNDWIWRRTQEIWTEIRPIHMVIMWSYTHRRELQDPSLGDEQRRLHATQASNAQDFAHWTDLVNKVYNMDRNIVQCTIPAYNTLINRDTMLQAHWHSIKGKDWPVCPRTLAEFESLPNWIIHELKELHGCYSSLEHLLLPHYSDTESSSTVAVMHDVIHIKKQLDWARDHHHFDILTAQWLVDRIIPRLTA
jgi:hypothetical protein